MHLWMLRGASGLLDDVEKEEFWVIDEEHCCVQNAKT